MTTMRFFQRQSGRYVGMMVCLALTLLAERASATYHADFFDISKRPTVAFDKGHLTWTLRNRGVERTIYFDAKAGSLQTLALRDLHTHHVLTQAPDGEGEITFASPLLQTPVPLAGWKVTATDPGSGWAQPNFRDDAWSAIGEANRPVRADAPVFAPVWFRVTLPPGRLKAGHAYALYLPRGFWNEGEVYADGNLIQKYAAARPSRLTEADQIDLPPGCRVIAIRGRNGSLHHVGAFLPAYTVEVGTSPPPLRLNSDWQYMMHTVNAGEDNSRILTIHLAGLKQYEGFDLDVCYQIYAGEEPGIAKWFSFVSHRKSRFLVDTVTADRWMLPGAYKPSPPHGDLYAPFWVQAVPETGDALLVGQMSGESGYASVEASGKSAKGNDTNEGTQAAEGQSVAPRSELNVAVRPELPLQTPRSLTAFWHGSQGTGLFLYQLYVGQYIARGDPASVPIAYSTEYAYGDKINAASCEKLIPLAADLGAQAFMLSDGWQTNIAQDTGRYGDWITDKSQFPKGLLPISTLARENHLRFGLWVDAAHVNARSQAAAQHPQWLAKAEQARDEDGEYSGERMCFTGAWARQFTQSILSLCREQSVTYLQTRFQVQDACLAADHEHPVGHSAAAEQDAWKTFCDTLHAADKTLAVVNEEGGSELSAAAQDADHYSAWRSAAGASRSRLLLDWRTLAALDLPIPVGSAADQGFFALPAFVRHGQALCHGGTNTKVSRDQLNYFWTTVAAVYPNFEIQGDLEHMTPDEREIGQKWIAWNLQNRAWLAFTQPLALAPFPAPKAAPLKGDTTPSGDPNMSVRGLLHLRNALNGRYGYVCLWNTGGAETTVMPSFTPSDYFVRMKTGEMSITNIQDNSSAPFSTRGGTISLGKITLPAYGWAVYEIRAK